MSAARLPLLLLILCALIMSHCAGSRNSQTGTISFITIDEELTLGEDLSTITLRYLDIIRNRTLNNFLNDMANRIGKVSNWSGLPFTVFVINNREINHFSLPGGNIYLFRGLIEQAETADEIAVILAHEIAHLTERHSVSRLAEKYGASFAAQAAIGENPEIAEHIIASLYKESTILDYPASNEYTADALALDYAEKAAFNPRYLALFLAKLQVIEKEQPDKVRLLMMTHPSTSKRLRHVKKVLKKMSANPQNALELAVAFQSAKQALSKIPQ